MEMLRWGAPRVSVQVEDTEARNEAVAEMMRGVTHVVIGTQQTLMTEVVLREISTVVVAVLVPVQGRLTAIGITGQEVDLAVMMKIGLETEAHVESEIALMGASVHQVRRPNLQRPSQPKMSVIGGQYSFNSLQLGCGLRS